MGLYNFQQRFVAFIEDGRKRHTIRGKRSHPDKPGNTLHLYTGLRTKKSRLIMRVECVKVEDIRITDQHFVYIEGNPLSTDECDAFAQRDGFNNFADMMDFWDGRLPFQGDVVHWKFEGKK